MKKLVAVMFMLSTRAALLTAYLTVANSLAADLRQDALDAVASFP